MSRSETAHIRYTPYRPQPNLVECTNRTLKQKIGVYVGNFYKSWDKHLAKFAYVLRRATREYTGETLAELLLGRKLLTPFERISFTENQLSEREREYFTMITEAKLITEALKSLEQAQANQAKFYNLRRQEIKVHRGDNML